MITERPLPPPWAVVAWACTKNMDTENYKKDIEENKLVAAIGYLGILCLVPLILKRDSAFAQHHGKQGLVVFVAWIILWIGNILPVLGPIIWFVGSILLLILVVMGITNTLSGNLWEMPYLGKFAKQVKL